MNPTATTSTVDSAQAINPWGSSLDKLKEWDPHGAELLLRVGSSPWNSGVLPRKEVELISLALNCSCTNLDEAVRAAIFVARSTQERRATRLSWCSNVVSVWRAENHARRLDKISL